MTVDKNYCMSSYLTVRYIDKPDYIFKEGVHHNDHISIPLSEKYPCKSAADIDNAIKKILSETDLSKAAIMLSGGIDSAILASYMPKGTKAYTARCVAANAIDETVKAREYCDRYGLEHIIVDVTWEDYEKSMEELAFFDGTPIIPNEPQAYIMCKKILADGADLVVYGDCADTEFGGMDKLLSRDWTYYEWIERFTFLAPKKVLKNPVDVNHIYEEYKIGENAIDVNRFISEVYAKSAAGALTNAFDKLNLKYVDPYEHMTMAIPLDINRVRSGESKYLIRELFKMKYPDFDIPNKIAMSRPADEWLKNWNGPTRDEFLPGCIEGLTGEQKLLVYSLERFLDIIENK